MKIKAKKDFNLFIKKDTIIDIPKEEIKFLQSFLYEEVEVEDVENKGNKSKHQTKES